MSSTATKSKPKSQPKTKTRPEESPTVKAPRAEDVEPKKLIITKRLVGYAAVGSVISLCTTGWFLLSIKHKLETSKYEAMFGQVPATLYAAGHAWAQMANNPIQVHAPLPPNVPMPPPPPAFDFHQDV